VADPNWRDALALVAPKLHAANFAVIVDGETHPLKGGFRECSGLGAEIETTVMEEPGDHTQRLFPLRARHQPVTLTKGIDPDGWLYAWFLAVKLWQPGRADYRRNVTIYQLASLPGNIAAALRGWDLFRTYPLEWSGPQHNAMVNEIATEKLKLHYEEIAEAPLLTLAAINWESHVGTKNLF
jgi:phage tail-like protein